jgi:hypothetical protein
MEVMTDSQSLEAEAYLTALASAAAGRPIAAVYWGKAGTPEGLRWYPFHTSAGSFQLAFKTELGHTCSDFCFLLDILNFSLRLGVVPWASPREQPVLDSSGLCCPESQELRLFKLFSSDQRGQCLGCLYFAGVVPALVSVYGSSSSSSKCLASLRHPLRGSGGDNTNPAFAYSSTKPITSSSFALLQPSEGNYDCYGEAGCSQNLPSPNRGRQENSCPYQDTTNYLATTEPSPRERLPALPSNSGEGGRVRELLMRRLPGALALFACFSFEDRAQLSSGAEFTLEKLILVDLLSRNRGFRAEGQRRSGDPGITLCIKEAIMAEEQNQNSSKLCAAVSLGRIELDLEDLLALRPGSVISLPRPKELEATIAIGDTRWARVSLDTAGERLQLTVRELLALPTEAGNPLRLLSDLEQFVEATADGGKDCERQDGRCGALREVQVHLQGKI